MTNHYHNLLAQVDKLHRHNRQGSYKTRARYYEAMLRFIRFLAEVFRLERLANIAPKHIYAYVAKLQEQGIPHILRRFAKVRGTPVSESVVPTQDRMAPFRQYDLQIGVLPQIVGKYFENIFKGKHHEVSPFIFMWKLSIRPTRKFCKDAAERVKDHRHTK